MRLAVSNLAWEPASDGEMTEVLRECGVAGVELVPEKGMAGCPFAVVSLQSLLFGIGGAALFGGEEERECLREALRRALRIAGRLGAGAVVFGSPKHRLRGAKTMGEAMGIAVPFFRGLSECAAAYRVDICFEPNAAAYGADFVVNSEEAVRLVEAVGHPRFRVNLDLSTLILNGERIGASVRMLAPYVGHCHASEPFLEPLGQHSEPHREFAGALAENGYDRWVSIEMKTLANPAATVRDAVEFCRGIYSVC